MVSGPPSNFTSMTLNNCGPAETKSASGMARRQLAGLRLPGSGLKRFLASTLSVMFSLILTSSCGTEPANDGFCGIIPKRLEAALSYGNSLYLGTMPDQAFLQEDQERGLRRIPPLEVREDPMAVKAVSEGRCALSVFEESFASQRQELQGLKSAQLLYGYPDSVVFRLYVNPAAIASDEARTRTLSFLQTLWSDEFQNKLEFYGLKPVPAELRTQVRDDLPEYLAPTPKAD